MVGRNVEWKARCAELAGPMLIALAEADRPPEVLEQEDRFFPAPLGRLKLRRFLRGGHPAELIAYRRADAAGARESAYYRVPVADPAGLADALAAALGAGPVVRKRRVAVLAGPVRLHFDAVAELGTFLECEVVMPPGMADVEATLMAERWRSRLGVAEADLVRVAYADLLAGGTPTGPDLSR